MHPMATQFKDVIQEACDHFVSKGGVANQFMLSHVLKTGADYKYVLGPEVPSLVTGQGQPCNFYCLTGCRRRICTYSHDVSDVPQATIDGIKARLTEKVEAYKAANP